VLIGKSIPARSKAGLCRASTRSGAAAGFKISSRPHMNWRNLRSAAHVKVQRCGLLEWSKEKTHSRALFRQFPPLIPPFTFSPVMRSLILSSRSMSWLCLSCSAPNRVLGGMFLTVKGGSSARKFAKTPLELMRRKDHVVIGRTYPAPFYPFVNHGSYWVPRPLPPVLSRIPMPIPVRIGFHLHPPIPIPMPIPLLLLPLPMPIPILMQSNLIRHPHPTRLIPHHPSRHPRTLLIIPALLIIIHDLAGAGAAAAAVLLQRGSSIPFFPGAGASVAGSVTPRSVGSSCSFSSDQSPPPHDAQDHGAEDKDGAQEAGDY
jgi:hypothetical protein